MNHRPIVSRQACSAWMYVELAWLRVVVFHDPRPEGILANYFEWRWLHWPRWELQFARLDVRWNIHGWRPWPRRAAAVRA